MQPQDTIKDNATRKRKHQMAEAWKAYDDDFVEPLKIGKDGVNDNVITNRCAPIVDTGVDFLFGLPVKIEFSGNESAQKYLDSAWGTQDDRIALFQELAIQGAICGTAFLKIDINPNLDPKIPPQLVALDPQAVDVQTDPMNCKTPICFTIGYDSLDDAGAQVSRRQVIQRMDPDGKASANGGMDLDSYWTITNQIRTGGNAAAWTQDGPPLPDWQYPFPPIVSCQNMTRPRDFWGKPDLTTGIIRHNNTLNFAKSNVSRIIKFHASPKTWGKGFSATQLRANPDQILIIESMDGTLQNLEMHSDLKSSMEFITELRDDMDEYSQVPAVATGRVEALPKVTSGVALQMLYGPLVAKTNKKRIMYGKLIRKASVYLLILGNFLTLDDLYTADVELHWRNPLPNDDLPAAQTALAWSQLGVSDDTLMQRAGFDPELEVTKSEAESVRKLAAQPPPAPGQPAPNVPPQPGQTPTHPAMVANMQAMQNMAAK